MSPNSLSPLSWSSKSDRVVRLLATCIRSAVRFRYSEELPESDAIDLARIFDLQSALKVISEKMQVHQSFPDRGGRFTLAIAEAKQASEIGLGIGNIVEIREAAIDAMGANQSGASQRRAILAELHAVREDARRWGKEYARFLAEIGNLYKTTVAQLDSLHLAPNTRSRAQLELENIIAHAMGRGGEV